jgi:hypothetical protein
MSPILGASSETTPSTSIKAEDKTKMEDIPTVDRLTAVKKLTIVDSEKVHLESKGRIIDRLTEDGRGIYDDRHYGEGETGKIKDYPNARQPDEIWLKPGEACRVGTARSWSDFKLIRIERGFAIFRQILYDRAGRKTEGLVKVGSYNSGASK